MEREVEIRSEMIRLGQLLKLAGVIDAGGQAAAFLATTAVLVNGEPEQRRGRQLHAGDTIQIGDEVLRLTRRGEG
jgi:ribosome-associated protein